MWANEQEAAVLSGVGPDTYRRKVAGWEKRGFPQVNPENGRRSIPAILAFFGMPQNHIGGLSPAAPNVADDPDEDGRENWNV